MDEYQYGDIVFDNIGRSLMFFARVQNTSDVVVADYKEDEETGEIYPTRRFIMSSGEIMREPPRSKYDEVVRRLKESANELQEELRALREEHGELDAKRLEIARITERFEALKHLEGFIDNPPQWVVYGPSYAPGVRHVSEVRDAWSASQDYKLFSLYCLAGGELSWRLGDMPAIPFSSKQDAEAKARELLIDWAEKANLSGMQDYEVRNAIVAAKALGVELPSLEAEGRKRARRKAEQSLAQAEATAKMAREELEKLDQEETKIASAAAVEIEEGEAP